MADLSLGPLRIANPDDASSPDTALEPRISQHSTQSVSPVSPNSGEMDYLSRQRNLDSDAVSPMDQVHINSAQAAARAVTRSPTSRDNYLARQTQRNSMAYTYQDQQQEQFPQYPTMMPQNLHDPRSNASRPVSTFYTQPQPQPATASANGVDRQRSYRTPGTAARAGGVPQRSASRGGNAMLAGQAGVPTADDTHMDRKYGQGSYNNGTIPRRSASKGVSSGGMGSAPINNSVPLSSSVMSNDSVLSGSPYNRENGPLSSSEEWQERGAAVGVQQEYDANGQPIARYVRKGVKDFNFGQTLGEGSYSTVLAAQDRQTLKDYAIKVLDKKHIIKEKKVKYVNIEKDTLNRLTDHPGVVRLYYTFQDERSLYFVLDLCSGGELLGVLKRVTTFDEECTRFYGAQILDTIEYMHNRGVIHRDLKPENVLLDDKKHIKITDFGTAKILKESKDPSGRSTFQQDTSSEENRARSFVGTAEYVSPELLTDKNACKASDLWAFGCIIYQLLSGRPPFKAGNEYQTFQKIVALDYSFPRGFPEVAKDLVERLLVLDPQRRLSIEHIKNHQFFDGIKWGKGLWQQKAPRLKPYVPPPSAPINLNGSSNDNFLDMGPGHSTHPTILPPVNSSSRPQTRVVTDLPPPSQLDIEWSPVLTRNNERILKLGNMSVSSAPNPHSPNGGQKKGGFSRLFGGGNDDKKRQRLVMVTSSARIIIAAAGGDEKKAKAEIALLAPGTDFSSSTDPKGVTQWTVNNVSTPSYFACASN
jgi:3-phosphoinositide dependent protein kinase-1